jgi:hypothetical protein
VGVFGFDAFHGVNDPIGGEWAVDSRESTLEQLSILRRIEGAESAFEDVSQCVA